MNQQFVHDELWQDLKVDRQNLLVTHLPQLFSGFAINGPANKAYPVVAADFKSIKSSSSDFNFGRISS